MVVSVGESFNHFAKATARACGHPYTFAGSVLLVVVWALTGPLFRYSDTWQLAINTTTTVLTFLAVFLIQNTQNRDAAAMQIKLDELIRAVQGAQNQLVNLEELSEEELDRYKARFAELATRARDRASGQTDGPELPADDESGATSSIAGNSKTDNR
jgi:low affinity Fe/Cu permease